MSALGFLARLAVALTLLVSVAAAQTAPNEIDRLMGQMDERLAAHAIPGELADLRANRVSLPLELLNDGIGLAMDEAAWRRAGLNLDRRVTLGMLLMQLGRTLEALSRGVSVSDLQTAARFTDGMDRRVAMMNTAEVQRHALLAYRTAATHLRASDDPELWADLQFRLGYALRNWSDFPEDEANRLAAVSFSAALDVYAADRRSAIYADTANNLAIALINSGDANKSANVERAIALLTEVLTTRTMESAPFAYADSQINLASAYRERVVGDRHQNMAEAIRRWQAALVVYTARTAPRENVEITRLIGRAYLQLGDWSQARDNLSRAAGLSDALIVGGFARDAEATVVGTRGVYDSAAYSAARLGNGREAVELLEQGRARLLGATLGLETLNLSETERRRLMVLRDTISEMANSPRARANSVELEQLRFEASALYRRGLAPSNAPDLAFGAYVIMPIFIDVGALGLIIDPAGNVRVHAPSSWHGPSRSDRVLGAANQWLARFQAGAFRRGAEEAMAASETSWGRDLGELIAASGARAGDRVVVVLDPLLATLPIAVGRTPGAAAPLSQIYDLSVTPSLAALRASQTTARRDRSPRLAITSPPADLPSAPIEIASVQGRFGAAPVAIDAALSAQMSEASVWHFLTHGRYDFSRPWDSALLLADGSRITLGQINARAYTYTSPRLVVLSACQSGVASGDGILSEFRGFPTAFLQLRAGGVVASSWDVDDLATTMVMSEFYRLLVDQRMAPARALRLAEAWLSNVTVEEISERVREDVRRGRLTQAEARNAFAMLERTATGADRGFGPAPGPAAQQARPFNSPYYWGAFQLYGW